MAAAETPIIAAQNDLQTENFLPLDAPERRVCFNRGGTLCRHIFRGISAADWDAFFFNAGAGFGGRDRGSSHGVDTDTATLMPARRARPRADRRKTGDSRQAEE